MTNKTTNTKVEFLKNKVAVVSDIANVYNTDNKIESVIEFRISPATLEVGMVTVLESNPSAKYQYVMSARMSFKLGDLIDLVHDFCDEFNLLESKRKELTTLINVYRMKISFIVLDAHTRPDFELVESTIKELIVFLYRELLTARTDFKVGRLNNLKALLECFDYVTLNLSNANPNNNVKLISFDVPTYVLLENASDDVSLFDTVHYNAREFINMKLSTLKSMPLKYNTIEITSPEDGLRPIVIM